MLNHETINEGTRQRLGEDLAAGCERISPAVMRARALDLGYRTATDFTYTNTGNSYAWHASSIDFIDLGTNRSWSVGPVQNRAKVDALIALKNSVTVCAHGRYWEM
jgi:hypothetical protein